MVLSENDLITMGDHFVTAKKYSPSSPHPGAPNTYPYNVILAPITTFIDKLKHAVLPEAKQTILPEAKHAAFPEGKPATSETQA